MMWTIESIKKMVEESKDRTSSRRKEMEKVYSGHRTGKQSLCSYDTVHKIMDLLAQSESDLSHLCREIEQKILGKQ